MIAMIPAIGTGNGSVVLFRRGQVSDYRLSATHLGSIGLVDLIATGAWRPQSVRKAKIFEDNDRERKMAYQAGRHFLQIPGPTNVPDRVLHAMEYPTIDHRSARLRLPGAGLFRRPEGRV